MSFEFKYNKLIRSRLDTLENTLTELQFDQARLNSTTGVLSQKLLLPEDSHFDDQGLYPTTTHFSYQTTDKLLGNSYDSAMKDHNVLNISKTLMDMKNE